MATKLTVVPPENCLIETLTEKLAELSSKQLSELSLILPTGRLATFLLANLAKRKKAFFPPKVTTLDGFINSFEDSSELSILSDNACDILLSKYIEEKEFDQISKGHEREIRLFIGEIFDRGFEIDHAYNEIETVLSEDIYKNDEHQGSLYRRFEQMRECSHYLLNFLKENGFELPKQRKARKAKNAELALKKS